MYAAPPRQCSKHFLLMNPLITNNTVLTPGIEVIGLDQLTDEQLQDLFSKIDRTELLSTLSAIGMSLTNDGFLDEKLQTRLVRDFIDPQYYNRLSEYRSPVTSQGGRPILFGPPQIRKAMGHALAYSSDGQQALSDDSLRYELGTALLSFNDSGADVAFPKGGGIASLQRAVALETSVYRQDKHLGLDQRWYSAFAKSVFDDAELLAAFVDFHSCDPTELVMAMLCINLYFMGYEAESYKQVQNPAIDLRYIFGKCGISKNAANSFIQQSCGRMAELRPSNDPIASTRDLYSRPYLLLDNHGIIPLDLSFARVQFSRGLFEAAGLAIGGKKPLYARKGKAFENYCSELMEHVARQRGGKWFPPDRYNGHEIDGMYIEAGIGLLFEDKSTFVPTLQKTNPDVTDLRQTLREKFIDDEGISQLATRLHAIRAGKINRFRGADVIVPILLVEDPFVATRQIQSFLREESMDLFPTGSKNLPVCVLHHRDLYRIVERAKGYHPIAIIEAINSGPLGYSNEDTIIQKFPYEELERKGRTFELPEPNGYEPQAFDEMMVRFQRHDEAMCDKCNHHLTRLILDDVRILRCKSCGVTRPETEQETLDFQADYEKAVARFEKGS